MKKLFRKSSRVNIFKSFTLQWWQGGIFKWGVLALGIAIGTRWHDCFNGYLFILIGLAAVSLTYITYVWWKQ
jgi:hypothetical protein